MVKNMEDVEDIEDIINSFKGSNERDSVVNLVQNGDAEREDRSEFHFDSFVPGQGSIESSPFID